MRRACLAIVGAKLDIIEVKRLVLEGSDKNSPSKLKWF
jgi:hypothetical protein